MGRDILDNDFGTGGCPPSAAVRAKICAEGYAQQVLEAFNATRPLEDRPAIDLVEGLDWPARDQWRRGTCTAFAAAALAEHAHARACGRLEAFSPEFLYWCMRKEPGYTPDPGMPYYELGATKLDQARRVLADLGLCREKYAPYVPNPHTLMRRPSQSAWDDAAAHRFEPVLYDDFEGRRPDFDVAHAIYEELSQGRPVALGLPIFGYRGNRALDNWTNSRTMNTGRVMGPVNEPELVDPDAVVSGHVVCVTGYQPDPGSAAGGWFIFKNSWAARFNDPVMIYHPATVPAITRRGYGAVSVAHVLGYTLELLSVKVKA
ncbi:hypothetical protein PSA7680_03107 [Pseudoruegeria aquimaris]|uniref:Papain family cysteine protease n=1 Tax=Pseudoruegeria aquimaris TaxID=393663 RepID=A0A1Y5TAI5_9RHOB|nr:hypothetical protein [Pseudoruegeria aquimaris]SLN59304.1 hypothetical protein PSA7680_03107 [Pseudoruegeria aquimaris]